MFSSLLNWVGASFLFSGFSASDAVAAAAVAFCVRRGAGFVDAGADVVSSLFL